MIGHHDIRSLLNIVMHGKFPFGEVEEDHKSKWLSNIEEWSKKMVITTFDVQLLLPYAIDFNWLSNISGKYRTYFLKLNHFWPIEINRLKKILSKHNYIAIMGLRVRNVTTVWHSRECFLLNAESVLWNISCSIWQTETERRAVVCVRVWEIWV